MGTISSAQVSACPTLAPPPQPRRRPSSTTLRAALDHRRSISLPDTAPLPPSSPLPSPPLPLTPVVSNQPMFFVVACRLLHWMRLRPDQDMHCPPSPEVSPAESMLPISSHKSSFSIQPHSDPPRSLPSRHRFDFFFNYSAMIFVVLLFPISTALILFCLYTLPISVSWPRTISDVAQIGRELQGYTQSGTAPLAHVVGVVAVTAIWKHAWSVPGSVIWNVLAGALFSPAYATILLSTLTVIGSVCASLLAMPLAPVLANLFPRALDMTRNALEGDSESVFDSTEKQNSPAWVRLSILRLVGVIPWSGINIACGVCGVSVTDCMMGTFIGCLPWTAVTCQIGDILQTVASTPSPTPQSISSFLTSPKIISKLAFLSFLSLAPILARDRLRLLISPSLPTLTSRRLGQLPVEDPQWLWMKEWRSKLRLGSRIPQEQQQGLRELAVLVQEKCALEELPS